MRIQVPPLRVVVENALLVALLVGATQAGLGLALAPRGPNTVLWPPPGLSLAALVLLGARVWPGVLLGTAISMLLSQVPPVTALAVASVQCGLQVAGAALLLRLPRFSMRRPMMRDALAFIGVSLGLSLLRTLLRMASLLWTPPVPDLPEAPWAVRFGILAFGDLLGLLLLGSALLAWLTPSLANRAEDRASEAMEARRTPELFVLITFTAVTVWVLFGGITGIPPQPSFVLVPALLWGGLRFGARGATLVSLLTAAGSVYLTRQGFGPLRTEPLLWQVLQLQFFLVVSAGAGLIFAAAWTERDKVAQDSRRHAARYRALVDGLPDGLLRLDVQGTVLDLVAQTGPLRGMQRAAIGKPLSTLLGEQTATALLQAASEARAGGQTVHCSLQLLGPEEPRDVECTVNPSEAGEVTVLARDVTEIRRLQTQVLLSDRLAAVGSLAAGVAHEINNPLAYVSADLEQVRELLGEPPGTLEVHREELRELVKESLGGTARIARVVRDLRTFAARGTQEREPIDLVLLLDDCAALASNELRHRARLVRDFQRVPQVLGSPAALGQVFLNLILNAAQSIPDGAAESNEVRLRLQPAPGGGAVEVEVRDTGVGVPAEHLSRIFDPFFSTKPVGSGAGLGLAVCHRLVAAAGGQISLESSPGQGTRVRVRLPLEPPARGMCPAPGSSSAAPLQHKTPVSSPVMTPPPPPPAPLVLTPPPERKTKPAILPASPNPGAALAPPPVVGATPLSARARLLVVDDEPLVARSLVRMLVADYDVDVATSLSEARTRLMSGPRIDAILSDLMMPDGTGMDLHQWLEKVQPAQAARMIFMTGGAFTDAASAFLTRVTNARLEKPFVPAEVRDLIKAALQRPR